METETIRCISAAGADLDDQILSQEEVFNMSAADSGGERMKCICSKQAFINIELHIGHRSALRLRNVKW